MTIVNFETKREKQSLGQVMQARLLDLDVRRKEPEKYRPVPTGFPDLDKIIGGIPVADPFYMLLFSHEKIGKTTIGMALANAWRKGIEESGEKILYVQLEELASQYADRTFASMTSLTRRKIRMYDINDDEYRELEVAAQKISDGPDNLYVQDNLSQLDAIFNDGLSMGCNKFVIDNLQLVNGKGYQGARTEREQIAAVSEHLVRARNNNGISAIVISQEGHEGKAFGSGDPNRDADILIRIGYVYVTKGEGRDAVEEKVEGLRSLNVLESRLCGSGYCEVAFDGSKNLVTPITKKDINAPDFIKFLELEGPPPVVLQ